MTLPCTTHGTVVDTKVCVLIYLCGQFSWSSWSCLNLSISHNCNFFTIFWTIPCQRPKTMRIQHWFMFRSCAMLCHHGENSSQGLGFGKGGWGAALLKNFYWTRAAKTSECATTFSFRLQEAMEICASRPILTLGWHFEILKDTQTYTDCKQIMDSAPYRILKNNIQTITVTNGGLGPSKIDKKYCYYFQTDF